jgi:hypothetical protein
MTMTERTYSQLRRYQTFEERFDYLSLRGRVAERTFGGERWLNQDFYRSREWKLVRNQVLARDFGCDMGIEGLDIFNKPIIHHMNPITRDQVADGDPVILDPEFLITVTHETHNAIHYGNANMLSRGVVERSPGDTRLWP